MIPAERDINNVGLLGSFEVLDFLRSKIAVVLRWVDLESLAPDVYIRFQALHPGHVLIFDQRVRHSILHPWSKVVSIVGFLKLIIK